MRLCRAGLVVTGRRTGGVRRRSQAQRVATGRVLVAPFETSRDPRASWLGEGVAVLLADDLNASGRRCHRARRTRARLRSPASAAPGDAHARHGDQDRAAGRRDHRRHWPGRAAGPHPRAARAVGAHRHGPHQPRVRRARHARRPAGASSSAPPGVSCRRARRPRADEAAAARCRPSSSSSRGLLAETPAAQVGYLEKALVAGTRRSTERVSALGRAHAVTGEWLKARDAALAVPAGSPLCGARAARGRRRRDRAHAVRRGVRALEGAGRPDRRAGGVQQPRRAFSCGAARRRKADGSTYLLQPGRRSRSRAGRLRLQPGLRLLARAGLPGGRVLAARGRAPRARRQRRALCAGRRAAGHRRGHRGGARARAGAAPVGGVRRTGHARRSPTSCRPISSGCGPISIRPALDGRTRR